MKWIEYNSNGDIAQVLFKSHNKYTLGHFMITPFNSKRTIIFCYLCVMVTACSTAPLPPQETLTGNWSVDTIQSKSILSESSVDITFNKDETLTGSASCNRFSSNYILEGNDLTIKPMAVTRKMCSPASMTQESMFLQSLSKVKRFQLNNGQLSLFDQQGAIQISASRKTL